MKVIIDPYRGGNDTGEQINNQYEKNILLNLSKYMAEKLNELGINISYPNSADALFAHIGKEYLNNPDPGLLQRYKCQVNQ